MILSILTCHPVEYATNLFTSTQHMLTKLYVIVPAENTTMIQNGHQNSTTHFAHQTTPAITRVAACIIAETTVGPSIASGSQ